MERQAHDARVVAVDGEHVHRHLLHRLIKHSPHAAGRADADRVAQRDLVAAHVQQGATDPGHYARLDLALVRAPEHA